MPHRLVSVAILLFWLIAATALFFRDLLPNLVIGPPPDLHTVAQADDSRPTRWAIQVADPNRTGDRRAIGQLETTTVRKADESVRMTSRARFDAEELFKGTAFASVQGEQIEVVASSDVRRLGNLEHFWLAVYAGNPPRRDEPLLTVRGRVEKDVLQVTTRSFIPAMNRSFSLPYRAREMVETGLSPFDRMPGLRVGQRWQSRVVSPLTGLVQTGEVSVERISYIPWGPGDNPVKVLEVVTTMAPLSMRTWVRPDGLVLRQEIPFFPMRKLYLQRLPDEGRTPAPGGARP